MSLGLIKDAFDWKVLIIAIGVSVFCLLIDIPELKKSELLREAKIAKIFSITNLIIVFGIYVIIRII